MRSHQITTRRRFRSLATNIFLPINTLPFPDGYYLDSSLSVSCAGTYSHAGGYSPGFVSPPSGVLAPSSARWSPSFIVHSAPAITSAQLNAELGIDGSLLAASFRGASPVGDVYSSIAAHATTLSSLGTVTRFDANARLDGYGLTASGPWASGFTSLPTGTSSVTYVEADFNQAFAGLITVPINEMFQYDVELASEAFVHCAFENWAVSDFFNIPTFDLSVSTPGLSLERIPSAVPLPPTLDLLLALCALMVATGMARRRRAPG